MIKSIRMYEKKENIYSGTFSEFYVFEIECECMFNNKLEKVSIEFLKDNYPFEKILRMLENKLMYFIETKIREEIREKVNENDDILKIRMMNKLME